MNQTLFKNHTTESYTKLNVFERLTLKKTPSNAESLFKSNLNTNSKPIISSTIPVYRSAIGPRVTDKRNEKEVEKITFPIDKYSSLLFPVDYAEHGLIIELQSQQGQNICRIKMDYNQYDILVNEIQHNFSMPIMQMSIKQIKVLLSDSRFPCFNISLQRVKGKIMQSKVQTNSFLSSLNSKNIVQIDPFKQVDESELRRKKMLMRAIPKLKIQRIHSKTLIDETTFEQSPSSELVSPKKSSITTRAKINNHHDYFHLDVNQNKKQGKKDIFKILTPRQKVMGFGSEKPKQDQIKTSKKIKIPLQGQHGNLGEMNSPRKKRFTQNEIQKFNIKSFQVSSNIKNLQSVLKSKQQMCSPKRV